MKVSVVVPVYNVAPYLEKCVASVLGQSEQDFEVILVDDGSSDGSGELCDALCLRDSRIKVIHQANGGLSAARNTGIRKAEGEIIMFLDSDDYWLSSDVLQFVSSAFQGTTFDFIEFECIKFKDGNEPTNHTWAALPLESVLTDTKSKDNLFIEQIKKGHLTACAWNKAIRSDLIIKHGLLFREGVIGEDIDWNARLLSCSSSIGISATPCVAYRKRMNSITSSSSPEKFEQLLSNLLYVRDQVLPRNPFLRKYLSIHVANAYIIASSLSYRDYSKDVRELGPLNDFLKENVNIKVSIIRTLIRYAGYTVTRSILRTVCFLIRLK